MSKKTEQLCGQLRPIQGQIWCDDHTDIYIGGCDHIKKLQEEQNHPKATTFETQGTCCDYLYFVCWSNDYGENGFIGEINGGHTVLTNDTSGWEVFPTGINRDEDDERPSHELVQEQIKKAHCCGWRPVIAGQKNDGSKNPFKAIDGSISKDAQFIWYNSGTDHTSAVYPTGKVPFTGYNHDEFLIFRLPVKQIYEECNKCECDPCDCDCGCSCHGCNEQGEKQQQELLRRAQKKEFTLAGKRNVACADLPFGQDKRCRPLKREQVQLCFYLHYGDGPSDQIETHDTEVIYLTVCNPYSNISIKKLRITELFITPAPGLQSNGESEIRIIPDQLIQFECLERCSCLSTELSLVTRGAKPNTYSINIKYCIDDISIEQGAKGENTFELEIVNS